MYSFAYHRAKNVKDAAALLKKADDAKLLAGGQTLIPTLKQRLAGPGALIDLGGVKELSGIALKGKVLVIGAMTRHAEVANSKVVKSDPALAESRSDGYPGSQRRHDRRLVATPNPRPIIRRMPRVRRHISPKAKDSGDKYSRACSKPR